MRASLIITAAGGSTRFSKSLPRSKKKILFPASKLFFELGGVPVLERTLRAFSKIDILRETLVTVPNQFKKEASAWGKSRGFQKVKWVSGGSTRAESVFLALKKTSPENPWVMVHDGARPLIQSETIQKLLSKALKHDAVLLARQVVPTLKQVSKKGDRIESTLDRSRIVEAETPQVVKRKVLLNAYRRVPDAFSFTDESSLVEAFGAKTGVLLHSDWNPKLTYFSDFELAEAKVNSGAEFRIGNGYDIHRLVTGRKLWIGGVLVPFEKGSLGHSDGDALLHSVTDAILGALGLGDIGDWFSDRDAKYKNIASSKLLSQVLIKVKELGWEVAQVDTNVILEKPHLSSLKIKIRASLAKLLHLPLAQVSVKARTYEGLPPFGTSEAWACNCVVMMKKKRG